MSQFQNSVSDDGRLILTFNSAWALEVKMKSSREREKLLCQSSSVKFHTVQVMGI